MRINRYKRVQRHLSFYKNAFGFRPPYQILVDGTFCAAALKYKVNIRDQMPKYLGDEVKLCTTVCAVTETESLGPTLYGATLVIKQFSVRRCGHEKQPITAANCFHSMVRKRNPDHYMVATQDHDLSERLRALVGVPLLYLFNAITLEKPSEKSEKKGTEALRAQSEAPERQMEVVKQLKRQQNLLEDEAAAKRKRRKPAGPNPLSCKKPKKAPKRPSSDAVQAGPEAGRKRRRHKRVKLAKHVASELSKSSAE
ncbi:rRNA-processing protein UTP23 homolog [Dermacentor variabilis]|uniref:rRNA-processing protein UTP23 homolog n=1 Tax=Dermacentor variabilis TaxID=34621 RepID=UPI003F5BBC5A